MPLPLIFWGIAAAGGAAIAWVNRKKIAEFFESESGQSLLRNISTAVESSMEPYKNMLDQCISKTPSERKIFFEEAKNRMSYSDWLTLVSYGKSIIQVEPKYMAVVTDLIYVHDQD